MSQKTIYQTLEDRGDPEYVEDNGPFRCNTINAWLGSGYYFWDTFIENAHWWGKNNRSQNYIICKTTFNFNIETCYDLHGNSETLLEFQKIINQFEKQKLLKKTSKVVEIIEFLKKKNIFKFPSIRVSSQKFHNNDFQIKYIDNNPARLELKPLIQICIYDLKSAQLGSFKIVYPDDYVDDCSLV